MFPKHAMQVCNLENNCDICGIQNKVYECTALCYMTPCGFVLGTNISENLF